VQVLLVVAACLRSGCCTRAIIARHVEVSRFDRSGRRADAGQRISNSRKLCSYVSGPTLRPDRVPSRSYLLICSRFLAVTVSRAALVGVDGQTASASMLPWTILNQIKLFILD
jgi:hypothetical protein